MAALVLGIVLVASPALARACPGCKEALFDPGQLPQRLGAAKGYAVSIWLLLAVPMVLIGAVAGAIARTSWKARRAAPLPTPPPH